MNAVYVECSSKEMQGVDEVFELAVNTAVGQEIETREQTQSPFQQKPGAAKPKKGRSRPCKIL